MVDAVYIHIPFCKMICSYCDFCKVYYEEKLVDQYLDALGEEITKRYRNEEINTLYIGGGTPSVLSIKQLKKLFTILKKFHMSDQFEMTFEANVDSLDEEKIALLKEVGVNRVSIGMETISPKLQKILGRKTDNEKLYNIVNLLKKYNITNINVDLIYAIKDETMDDLNTDLDFLLTLDIPHISTYSLIIEPHTLLYLNEAKPIDEEIDYQMYQLIRKRLREKEYIQYEISNFAKKGFSSLHNTKYWDNLYYYGFGVGAASYLLDERSMNTRSIPKYISGNYQKEVEKITYHDKIEYEIILAFRKKEGINKQRFYQKYQVELDKLYDYQDLVKKKVLCENENFLYLNEEYYYVMNEVIEEFLSSSKM